MWISPPSPFHIPLGRTRDYRMQNKTKENVNQTLALGILLHGDDDGENDAPNVPLLFDIPELLEKKKKETKFG